MANRPDVLEELRGMMRRGATPASLLRMIVERHSPEIMTGWDFMDYMTEAFALPLNKASVVQGWSPDGRGPLSDARLDVLLLPAIIRSSPAWDDQDALGRPEGPARWYAGLHWPAGSEAIQDESRYGMNKESWDILPEPDRQVFRAMVEGSKQMVMAADALATLAEHLQRRSDESGNGKG